MEKTFGETAKNDQSRKSYEYRRLPENIRQIGELTGKTRIYIEDYVLTYIRRNFEEKQEKEITVFIGKEGREEASQGIFIYGAVSLAVDLREDAGLTEEHWDELYQMMHQYFPGGRIMGWGCGVGIWNSQIDSQVRKLQKEHFAEQGKILFLSDLSEREEKVFFCKGDNLKEMTGYVVYFERNPQMQEYMLRGQQEQSFESAYEDRVTHSMRHVIQEKGKQKERMQYLAYGAGFVVLLLVLFGGNLLIESLAKIHTMENTIQALSGYVSEQKAVQKIAENQETGQPDKQAEVKETGQSKEKTDVRETSSPKEKTGVMETSQPPKAENSKSTMKPKKTAKPQQTAGTSSTGAGNGSGNAVSAFASGSRKGISQSYIVQKGDTLSQIVWRQYHSFVYLDAVMKANRISDSDRIYEGQRIFLPVP